MLRIGIPNKGTLAEPTATILQEAGYRQRPEARDLVLVDPDNDVEFFYLRPRDIATYVAAGQVEVGITGRDLLRDAEADAEEVLALGFGRSSFRYAALPGTIASLDELAGRRVATSFPGLVSQDLRARGVTADVIRLDGAVETAIRLGVADVVADVVSSGTTLRLAGLVTIGDSLLESEAVLIRRRGGTLPASAEMLTRRLQGVMIARQYVMIEYDILRDALEQACTLTPGIESPTISPLQDPTWAAVRAMVPRRDAHGVMDELYELGARGVIVFDILACRL
jgi:ATP phosphoribosyltransferase